MLRWSLHHSNWPWGIGCGMDALTGDNKTHRQVAETFVTPPPGNFQQEERYLYLGTGMLLLSFLVAVKATRKSKGLGHQNLPLPITTSL